MNKAAIPTRYAGVQFRSRLEARWAAFFDLVGWRWEYEPIDLDGYIPDFIINERLIAEVKPFMWNPGPEEQAVSEVKGKLDQATRNWWWVAILGARILPSTRDPDIGVVVGQLRERGHSLVASDEPGMNRLGPIVDKWGPADVCWWGDSRRVSIASQFVLAGQRFERPPDLEAFWREAGNRVQWRAPR